MVSADTSLGDKGAKTPLAKNLQSTETSASKLQPGRLLASGVTCLLARLGPSSSGCSVPPGGAGPTASSPGPCVDQPGVQGWTGGRQPPPQGSS